MFVLVLVCYIAIGHSGEIVTTLAVTGNQRENCFHSDCGCHRTGQKETGYKRDIERTSLTDAFWRSDCELVPKLFF